IGTSTESNGSITLNASVAGTVEGTSSTSSSSAPFINRSQAAFASSGNECAYSPYNVYKIGGDGSILDSGVASDGKFTASANEDHEIMIKFACGMRCFGKPGSTDLVCDAVSSSVVSALESSVGASVETSSLYKGLSVAKIAEGIVETLKLISQLDPTNNVVDLLIEKIDSGGSNSSIQEIIEASSVGSLFSSLSTLANEKAVENDALNDGEVPADARERAAKSQWNVEAVIKMLTGMGLEVQAGMGGEGGPGLYSDIFTQIDVWTNDNFVEKFREYIFDLHRSLYVDDDTLTITILCQASPDGQGDDVYYPPYIDVSDATHLTCMHADTSSDTDQLGITKNNGQDLTAAYRKTKLIIKTSAEEVDRNDPTGIRGKNRGIDDFSVDFIDVFSEFQQAMGPGGVCEDHVTMDPSDDGPESFDNEFGQCVQDNNLGKYFAGLLGIYKFMRNDSLRNAKFSLAQLYKTLAHKDYIGINLETDLWSLGLNSPEIKIDFGDGDTEYINRYQLRDTGQLNGGTPIFDLECPVEFCEGGDPTPDTYETDSDGLLSILSDYKPTYASTMQMFEEIPSMTDIKDSIFKSAHHEPYNIAGSEKFHVIGDRVDTSLNEWEADVPILCRIVNPNSVGDFVSGTSSIECALANENGITWGSDGKPDYPADQEDFYQSYFALSERSAGGNGGDEDRYYGLMNINNGRDYRVNGREFRVRGMMTPDVTADGKEVYSLNKEFCHTWEDSQGNLATDCWIERFDYVVVDFDNNWFRSEYYYPFSQRITVGDNWDIEIAVSDNSTDTVADDWAICIPDNGVSTDTTNDSSKVLAVLSLAGRAKCDSFGTEEKFYYLMPQWGADSSGNQKYYLVRDSGDFMWSDPSTDAHIINMSAIEAVLGGQKMGPSGTFSWINRYQIANLGHDPKYDPICDDSGIVTAEASSRAGAEAATSVGDGCSCIDEDDDGECTLADTFTEQTLSELPVWPGGPSAEDAGLILKTCGGYDETTTDTSGENLVDCLNWMLTRDNGEPTADIRETYVDWKRIFECSDETQTLDWIDIHGMIDQSSDGRFGIGCDDTTNDTRGALRMRKLVKRKNAYDIAKPNQLLRLISSATATTGTGITLTSTEKVFNFQEALAMIYMRIAFPMRGEVRDPSGDLDTGGMFIYMRQNRTPDNHSSVASSVLRAFLVQAGVL
ncbi:MAG: hypothetical protein GY786_11065, partial [Proteobacteria bacterium]|nr:hypothetical protein [Pseudomonadota bacterium]